MKTAQLIRRLNFAEWGGTENVVWNTARTLAAAGDEPVILATRALGGAPRERRDEVAIRRYRYLYPWLPLSRARRAALDKKGGNPFVPGMECELRHGHYELIHSHNLGRVAELAARAAKKCDIPLVLSLHGGCFDIPEAERRELTRPLAHTLPWGGFVERLLRLKCDPMRQADGIICVGANEVEAVRARYPDKLIEHLPNGVTPELFERECRYDWRRALGLARTDTLLLNVSRIDYQKNQKMLVEMVAALRARGKKVHLLMIGPVTSKWYCDELRDLVARRGAGDAVTIIPGLPPEDDRLIAAYRQADVFVLPSVHEPFGIVVLEAWSARLPVLASTAGGLGRLVRDGETGLQFEPESLNSLLSAYSRLNECADKLRAAGRREVDEKYDWKQIAARLRAFYQEVQARHEHHR